MTMGFWDLVQRYRDDSGASEAWIMRKAGLNKGAFTAWRKRGIPVLPEPDQVAGLARALRVSQQEVVDSILETTQFFAQAELHGLGILSATAEITRPEGDVIDPNEPLPEEPEPRSDTDAGDQARDQ